VATHSLVCCLYHACACRAFVIERLNRVPYPQCSKKPLASQALTAEIAASIALSKASRVRASAFREVPLIFEKASSMGLRSGE
jgi:hypothetical protein